MVYLKCPELQNWILFQCIKENKPKAKISKKKKKEVKDFLQIQFHAKTGLHTAIPQKKLNVNNSCRIYAKHFVEADIETITTNSWKIIESRNEPVELKFV